MATPPATEVAAHSPAMEQLQRISFLDEVGQPTSRERARIAVIREFDDHGNMISLMTMRVPA